VTAPDVFEYALIRVVPRVERGEAINVGVIVYSHAFRYLCARIELDEARLLAVDPAADLDAVRAGLSAFEKACTEGPLSGRPLGERFRWLTAPRSTIVQPGPVHSGLTADPAAELTHLFDTLVRVAPNPAAPDPSPHALRPHLALSQLISLTSAMIVTLRWRIRVIRRIWYPRGYQILHEGQILHAIPGRNAPCASSLSLAPRSLAGRGRGYRVPLDDQADAGADAQPRGGGHRGGHRDEQVEGVRVLVRQRAAPCPRARWHRGSGRSLRRCPCTQA
jgi:Protein of unknown function (DUF3037)